MRKNVILAIMCCVLFACTNSEDTSSIKINSLGYNTLGLKKATVKQGSASFEIKNTVGDVVVFKGNIDGSIHQNDSKETLCVIDFTALKHAGSYYIETSDGVKSDVFVIRDKAYADAYKTSMRAFYLWRCGTDVEAVYGNDVFKQKACHLDDGYLNYTEFGDVKKEGAGGWHDAGDYGKYIVNGGLALGQLFMGWDNFEPSLKQISLENANQNDSLPDYLAELKWETDWFLKMQFPDGSGRVSHKLTRLNFSGFIMPDADTVKRYFTDWGTAATAHFVGAMAMASRYFEPYDPTYAKLCLDAAKTSYQFLKENPEYKRWEQDEFHTGGYQPNETDGLIWAAAEMWETTGDASYLKNFEDRMAKVSRLVDYAWDWWSVKNLGVYTYLLSDKKGRDDALFLKMKKEMILVGDSIVEHTNKDAYGRPYGDYGWGCNGTVARLASNLYVANQLNANSKYKAACEDITSHIFGRNYYGRSYVTGLGVNPPMYPHDRRCGADSIVNPWPGYIVGGGHTATDWIDEEASYSHNEICINWQASLVYLLSWVSE